MAAATKVALYGPERLYFLFCIQMRVGGLSVVCHTCAPTLVTCDVRCSGDRRKKLGGATHRPGTYPLSLRHAAATCFKE